MKRKAIIWCVVMLLIIDIGLVSAQVRVPDPTPPNPAPNITAPVTPRVQPPEPSVPRQTEPISPGYPDRPSPD